MKCIIISEKELIDLGKRCLSNLIKFVNSEYFIDNNGVKRLRTLFFMSCQMVFSEQLNPKKFHVEYEKIYDINEKKLNKICDKKFEEKFLEVNDYVKKSKKGDKESKLEEVFNTPVFEKYSTEKFSLEEINRIFKLVENGLDKCDQIIEDLYCDIKHFINIYYVYDHCYKDLDRKIEYL